MLVRGKALYEAGDYLQCTHAFRRILGPEGERTLSDRDVAEEARLYYGACLLGIGQPARTDAVFRSAIRQSPQLQPSPLEFPDPVVERFEAVRRSMVTEIERADRERAERARQAASARKAAEAKERERQARLLRLAAEETVVAQNRRWIAAIPFGVGQFQNRSPTLGWVFLSAETLTLGATVAGMLYELQMQSRGDDPTVDKRDLNSRIETARGVWTGTLYGFVGVALIGIGQAEIAFVPSFREVRRRPLPAELRSPSRVSAEPSAASREIGLAVVGRF